MTLRQLEILRAVFDRRTLSAAAAELGLTQPAVSIQMKALAEKIGVPLFRRRGRRLEPTEAGRTLEGYAERILRLVAEAKATTPLGAGKALVRVAASSTPGVNLLPGRIAAYQRRKPGTVVRLEVLNSGQVEARVASGEADFGLVGGQLRHTGLLATSWREDRLVVIVQPTHPLARRRRVRAPELSGETLLTREHGSATRATVEAAFLQAGIPLPRTQVLGDTEAIKHAVAEGLGIGIVSRSAVGTEARSGDLSLLRIDGLSLTRPLWVIRDPKRVLGPPARDFLGFLGGQKRRAPRAARRAQGRKSG